MQLGMVGLGRMGANMVLRLMRGGCQVVAYSHTPEAVQGIKEKGAAGADSLPDLVGQLIAPRIVWMMVPAGDPVDQTIQALVPHLSPGDVIIDGGNSFYKDTVSRASALKDKGIHYVDVGTSGGVWGLKDGYSLMIGGDKAIVDRLTPIFMALAPTANQGWGHVGQSGAGHFTKMVHNGIEYGMMQAFAEGFSILQHKEAFGLNLHQVAQIWQHGSVVRSWLLDLTAEALEENPTLKGIAPYVSDSGEGRWTVAEAIDLGVPAPVITHSLIARLRSRDELSFADKLLAAMRNKFGGHAIKKE